MQFAAIGALRIMTNFSTSADSETSAVAPLGNTCEICSRSDENLSGTLQQLSPRAAKLILQAAARSLAPQKRVSKCLRTPTRQAESIEVKRRAGKAHFIGLQTCGSVWDCAVCAAKISERRAWELNSAANRWLLDGGSLLLATFTVQHNRRDSLETTLATIRAAYRAMKGRRDYRQARAAADAQHDVTALEVTHGRNGWHPHLHTLVFCHAPSSADQNAFGRAAGGAWQAAVKLAGGSLLLSVGFDLRGGDYAADYAAKWGAVREISNAANKKARQGGRTPQQLLAAYALAGDQDAARLWLEYSAAFHGRRQLTWSPGAKAALGITETTDDELAAANEPADTWAEIDLITWRCVVMARRDLRDELLRACEADDLAAFNTLLVDAVYQDQRR